MQLPAELLAVIEARYCDGLNQRQIAERLGISHFKVRIRHRKAIAMLRNNRNLLESVENYVTSRAVSL